MNNRFNALLLLLLLASGLVHAGGVTVGGTRLIYDGGKKEAPLNVTNSDASPYLIQSWVETPEGGVEKAPFIITPPLFRLEGNQQNILRVVRTGGNLPNDRESLYWLNVKTIPSGSKKEGTNTLQIAVKTRIKLLFRPQGLQGVPEDMADRLTWSQSGNQLTVTNPTPFIMNFQSVKVGGHEIKNVTYVMPQSQAIFPLQTGTSGPISWRLISDYGGTGDLHTSGH
ncbi:fimbria/pilus periplasmic chaperone [Serratia fonticola]|uniref:fimbrial biogenesis chaperone n=1 Tax=Serratia fonticola TaxID=47917 RepID=UPI0015C58E44|nr:fimbria/pilus periplasmic chaperone [Serratia fonticola]MBC3381674.1 fimbria/pilus periplasmic chaperone [Serratia fonticola]NYA40873.1 fimbria/pilus periplasmic chaperone [Serratia fonticola]